MNKYIQYMYNTDCIQPSPVVVYVREYVVPQVQQQPLLKSVMHICTYMRMYIYDMISTGLLIVPQLWSCDSHVTANKPAMYTTLRQLVSFHLPLHCR